MGCYIMYEATFKNTEGTLWKDAGRGCELDYIEQTNCILFRKYSHNCGTDKANSALLNEEVYNSKLYNEPNQPSKKFQMEWHQSGWKMFREESKVHLL